MSEAPATIEVLLVEDSSADARLTQEVLKGGKIRNHLTVVTDGVEALSYLRREGRYRDALRPDLVLLDLNLPKMDGGEVLREMKEDPDLRRIPVVVLTSSSAESDVLRSYELHANSYITKPPSLTELSDALKALHIYWFAIVRMPPE